MMATAAAAPTTTVMTLVIAVAPPHALVVLSVSHDCLSLTPVDGDYCLAGSFTQLQAALPKPARLKRLGVTGRWQPSSAAARRNQHSMR
jgi:hypothetical protein